MRRTELAALLIAFVALQTVDGRVVHVNPEFVVSLGTTHDDNNKTFTDQVQCIVNLVNGKFVTVKEDCTLVRRRLEDH